MNFMPWNLECPPKALAYVEDQLQWMREQSMTQRHYSLYWDVVGNYLSFVDGLVAGYEMTPMSFTDSDTGLTYNATGVDIKRHYMDNPRTPASHVAFSSFPGIMASCDDFYMNSEGLVAFETSYSVWEHDLYDEFLTHESCPTWMRTQVANWITSSPMDWSAEFGKENSGTYNNQWLVLQSNMFVPGSVPPPGFIYKLEIAPGFYRAWDATDELIDNGYIPSVNVPTDPFIANITGYTARADDPYYSYDDCARFHIFEELMPNVSTFEEFQEFMRYNNYENDPLTTGDPGQTIASRYDLRSPYSGHSRAAMGAIDAKCVNMHMARRQQAAVIAGPTSDRVPTFSFSDYEATYGETVFHAGLADVIPSTWVQFTE
ncbi:phospholipase B-like protein [Kipferlia bialata]|uniref:Phospholipase B-like n=1 Tax=Kipferlia bialata TaxID=797122 RepID=A0A9K3CYC0_9EUKA|nr:phospholipase B-like protein [Kipferlia bialata]|eukprot:g7193.t1